MNHRAQKYHLVKYDSLIDAEDGMNRYFENERFRVAEIHILRYSSEDESIEIVYVLFERIDP